MKDRFIGRGRYFGTLVGLVAALYLQMAPMAMAQGEDLTPEDIEKAKAFVEAMQKGEVDCAVDVLMKIPELWALSADELDKIFTVPKGVQGGDNPYFKWLTKTRTRAHFIRRPYSNLTVNLSLMEGEVPIEEAIVDFGCGKFKGVTLSVFNRGDAGTITQAEFERRKMILGKSLGERLETRPRAKKANITQGLLTEGWLWISEKGMAVMEYNPEALKGNIEFLRIRIAPRDVEGVYAAAMRDRSSAVRVSDLPQNVRRGENGEVMIAGIPMVDQGPKGYCVAATCQRLFEYYEIPCDQHQIAQIAGTDAEKGTSTLAMAESLEKIDYRFKTRFKDLKVSRFDDFKKNVVNYVDDGIPLLWCLELGGNQEEPGTAPQTSGFHMRLITGYNESADLLIFSDSWGAGHEKKFMSFEDAFAANHGLFVITPTVR